MAKIPPQRPYLGVYGSVVCPVLQDTPHRQNQDVLEVFVLIPPLTYSD